ncbi:MAG: cell division protein ZapA [Streptococcaceae bacterium]|nr:cell division protein ZapA [Streptococcaceae bacterium]
MVEKTRYKANISGTVYTIIGNETKDHMDMTTKLVDEQLRTLCRLVPGTTKEQAAILTAINAISDQLKKQAELIEVKKQLNESLKKASKIDELQEKLDRIYKQEIAAKAKLQESGETTHEMPNHMEAQQILNETAKQSIRKKKISDNEASVEKK